MVVLHLRGVKNNLATARGGVFQWLVLSELQSNSEKYVSFTQRKEKSSKSSDLRGWKLDGNNSRVSVRVRFTLKHLSNSSMSFHSNFTQTYIVPSG